MTTKNNKKNICLRLDPVVIKQLEYLVEKGNVGTKTEAIERLIKGAYYELWEEINGTDPGKFAWKIKKSE